MIPTDPASPPPPDGRSTTALPLVEETLDVSKRVVERGGYRVTKRVDTRDEIVDEPLQRVHVDVERRPVGRLLDDDGSMPAPRHEGDTTIYPVVEEVLVTQKRLLLTEEIRVTRRIEVRSAPQTVALRKETVSIERLDDGPSPPVPTL